MVHSGALVKFSNMPGACVPTGTSRCVQAYLLKNVNDSCQGIKPNISITVSAKKIIIMEYQTNRGTKTNDGNFTSFLFLI